MAVTEFEYRRFGHINGKLTPWVMRAACSACPWTTEWEPQPASDGMTKARAEHETSHDGGGG